VAGCGQRKLPGRNHSSFLSPLAPDNGCHQYRSYFPLHETYASIHSTQYTFATGFLRLNLATTPLVTIMLGVDDLLLLEEQCNGNPQCIENGLPEAYATAEANMTQILAGLRGTGYMGSIVIVNYYSPDYSNQFDTQAIPGLNRPSPRPPNSTRRCGRCVHRIPVCGFQSICAGQHLHGRIAGRRNHRPVSDLRHSSQRTGHRLIDSAIAELRQSPQRKAGR